MDNVLIVVAALVAAAMIYVFWFREWARERFAWFDAFLDVVEPVERHLWHKSRTVFLARLLWVPGALLTVHDLILPFAGLIDWNPIVGRLLTQAGVPESMHAVALSLSITLMARGFETLRKVTTEPLEDKV